MPQVPRIRRTIPSGDAIKPQQPLPVIVTMIWHVSVRVSGAAAASCGGLGS